MFARGLCLFGQRPLVPLAREAWLESLTQKEKTLENGLGYLVNLAVYLKNGVYLSEKKHRLRGDMLHTREKKNRFGGNHQVGNVGHVR